MSESADDPKGTLQVRESSVDREAPPGPVWALTVLYHPDIDKVGWVAPLALLSHDEPVDLSRSSPELRRPGSAAASPLGDEHLSRKPIRLCLGPDGGIRVDVAGSPNRLTVRRTTLHERETCDLGREELIRGVPLTLSGGIVLLLHAMDLTAVETRSFGLVGESAGIQRVRREIAHVADLDVAVLIRGETGTGKELVARAIHDASRRRERPFVAVNLGAIPPSLAAAELFGAAAGSFTGAGRGHAGYFQAAQGGTLFLDEIGEASPEVQAMLLRALESGEIQGVGAQRAQRADARIIAATDADLEAKIADRSFRAPLLHRLSSVEIALPPLRERRDDIGRLLVHFLREDLARVGDPSRFARAMGWRRAWLPATLVARLADLDWPGNVRQLRNVVRQLVVSGRGLDSVRLTPPLERLLAEAEMIASQDRLPAPRIPEPPPSVEAPATLPPSTEPPPPTIARRRPSEVSEDEVAAALRDARWELVAAAAALRISRASLYVLIENSPRFRKAGDLGAEEITRCYHACGGDLRLMVEHLQVSERALQRRVRELGLA